MLRICSFCCITNRSRPDGVWTCICDSVVELCLYHGSCFRMNNGYRYFWALVGFIFQVSFITFFRFFVSMHETRLASSQVLSARKYNLYPMSYRIVSYTAWTVFIILILTLGAIPPPLSVSLFSLPSLPSPWEIGPPLATGSGGAHKLPQREARPPNVFCLLTNNFRCL